MSIGRTGRIGNHGLATTFYNDNDVGIAPDLVKILLECDQEIPSFLEEFMPDDTDTPLFDDEGSDGDSDEGDGDAVVATEDSGAWSGEGAVIATAGDDNADTGGSGW